MNSQFVQSAGQSSAGLFNSLRLSDFNATTIEIDTNELQKDNHLVEFNRLEDILNFCNPRNTILVQLKKGLRGLGIALCGGKQTKIDLPLGECCENFALINQLIRVKKLYPAHPASECGLIDENDFILDVNDQCFVGLTYIEAFNILHTVQDEVTLRIFKFNQCPLELQNYLLPRDESASFELSVDFREANLFESTRIGELDESCANRSATRVRKVTLIKQDGSLGFTLSKIENEGFYVKQVLREPASLEQINPGDRILSVNSTSLDGLGLNDAIKLLRSLPDLCEFKLEQPCDSLANGGEDTTDNSLNYQSEPEDDSRFAKKPLRHEVKIMLDSRNKDPLHNRLKRKDLKKSKDESTKEQKSTETNLESSSRESSKRESDRESALEADSVLNESRSFSDSRKSVGESRSAMDNKLDNKLDGKLDSKLESKMESKLNKENNFDAFMKLNNRSQLAGEGAFFRQSSVMDYESRGVRESEQRSKQNNLNKWRNTIILSDEREEEEDSGCLTKSASLAFSASTNSNLNSAFKKATLKELTVDGSIGGDSISDRSSNRGKLASRHWNNPGDSQRAADRPAEPPAHSRPDAIQLADIQLKLKLNNDCLLSENSMYKQIENSMFFYVTLDRIGWHGRLGFSLVDDQMNDFRVVNTIKHGFSACIVKEVYPNSLAYTDGRIRVFDKLLEVNNQQLINKPVQTVIRDLRKLKGKLKLLFIRKVF